jgi:hypothetical protein
MDTLELASDGFPLDPGDPDIRYHRELSSWLELEASHGVPVALRFGRPNDWPDWLRVALRRFAWLQAHRDLIPGERQMEARLARLIGHLVNRIYPPPPADENTLAELARHAPAIEASGAGSMFRADTGRLLLAAAKPGVASGTLREQMHAMLRAIPLEDRFGSLHELAWLLFLDQEDPDDGEPCWSAQVRRELRALKPAARKPWMALLKLAPIRRMPDGKWAEKVKSILDKLGQENWRARAGEWSKAAGSGPSSRAAEILLRHMVEIDKALNAPPQTPPDSSELLQLLRQGSYSAFEQIAEQTRRHGYRQEIVEAVRSYHETLHGSVTDQARRQHVGWWLWLEDVMSIKTEECWSSIVRTDLRGFTGARKKAWMDLIGNMTFAVTDKPPAKWTKAAEAAMAALGAQEFGNQMRHWLAPLAEGEPLRLTTPGRDVLRTLIWDCALCPPDPQLDQALVWIGKATWKNKESRDRMSKIFGPLAGVLSARNPALAALLPQKESGASAPRKLDLQAAIDLGISQALSAMPMGDRIEMHPDHVIVRGELDKYRIEMDGVITGSCGRRVRVDIDALPPYLSQLVRPAVDAVDLEQGMFQPNRILLFSLAMILAQDAHWESAIK